MKTRKMIFCEIILQTGGLWDSIIQCKGLRDKKMQNPSPHQQIEKTKINGTLFCESAQPFPLIVNVCLKAYILKEPSCFPKMPESKCTSSTEVVKFPFSWQSVSHI